MRSELNRHSLSFSGRQRRIDDKLRGSPDRVLKGGAEAVLELRSVLLVPLLTLAPLPQSLYPGPTPQQSV